MVYGIYNYSIHGNINQLITGGAPSCTCHIFITRRVRLPPVEPHSSSARPGAARSRRSATSKSNACGAIRRVARLRCRNAM